MAAFILWCVVSFVCLLPGIHCEISGFPVYEEMALCGESLGDQECRGFTVREDEFSTSNECLSSDFQENEHKQIHTAFLWVLINEVNCLMLNSYWWFLFHTAGSVSGGRMLWKVDSRGKYSKGSWTVSLLRHPGYRFCWLVKCTSVAPPFRSSLACFWDLVSQAVSNTSTLERWHVSVEMPRCKHGLVQVTFSWQMIQKVQNGSANPMGMHLGFYSFALTN